MDFSVGSYHSREWWPWVKLMSVLWKMAAHWKGAAGRKGKKSISVLRLVRERKDGEEKRDI